MKVEGERWGAKRRKKSSQPSRFKGKLGLGGGQGQEARKAIRRSLGYARNVTTHRAETGANVAKLEVDWFWSLASCPGGLLQLFS